jgi:hypothetical protein
LGYAVHAEFALTQGEDARPYIEKMTKIFDSPKSEANGVDSKLQVQMIAAARVKFARGESPVEEATSVLHKVRSGDNGGLLRSSPARLLLIQWMMAQKTATEALFDDHILQLAPILDSKQIDPLPFQIAAAIHEYHAAWLVEQHKDPSNALIQGFGMVEESFKRNPRFAPAFATRGDLFVVEARAAKEPHAREEAARHAKEAFESALSYNKYLARETEAARQEVDRLLRGMKH